VPWQHPVQELVTSSEGDTARLRHNERRDGDRRMREQLTH